MSPEELQVVWLALKVGFWVVVLSLIPGIAAAWGLARMRSRFKGLLQGLVMLPLVLPPVVTGYLLLLLLGRSSFLGELWHGLTGYHIAYTQGAAVLAAAVVGFPLLVESVRLAMESVDPALENVSRSLGHSRWSTFRRITLPLSMPGILAGSVLTFARALGEFGATIILAGNIEGETRQIPMAVYTLLNQPGQEGAVMRGGRLESVTIG
ncbi:MAG: molybdate ABC transporter permease subunit, partial [Planctomycetota bacterium]|nr:molybdate ABC transporter permease subunit [Planctomycetota bacterium]